MEPAEPQADVAADARRLYQNIGGQTGLDALVHRFYDAVLGDVELAPFFRGTSVTRLRRMQTEFFAAALGGPVRWQGRTLGHIHRWRGIGPRQVERFLGHLIHTLSEFGLTEVEREAITCRIRAYVPQLTGTPES